MGLISILRQILRLTLNRSKFSCEASKAYQKPDHQSYQTLQQREIQDYSNRQSYKLSRLMIINSYFTLTSPSSFPTANNLSSSSKLTKAPIGDFEAKRSSILTFTFPVEDFNKQRRPSDELQIKSTNC